MKSIRLAMVGGVLAVSIATSALADLKTGDDAWQRGDYAVAVAEWRSLAIAGDPDAQVHMGQAYQLGRGVPVDLKLAEDWFRRAAQTGNPDGKDSYGLILFQNGKRAEALPYIEDAAGRGNPRAQYILGTALFNGDMIAKDWPRAYALMNRASAAGIPAAKASIAQMDAFIPLEQRNRGKALAGAFEAHANAQADAASKPNSRSTVGIAELPLSATSMSGKTGAPSVAEAKPVRVAMPSKPTTPAPAVPKPMARPSLPIPVPTSGGKWRIQLGAFADASSAHALWPGLRARIPALVGYRAFAVKAGAVTRLQAGPLASSAAASQLCAAVRAAKQACLPVAP